MRPCFGCTKEALQAKIHAVRYVTNWAHPNEDVRRQYEVIQARIPGGVRPLMMEDPAEVAPTAKPLEATGHEAEEQEGSLASAASEQSD
jgi:dCMP deaminase